MPAPIQLLFDLGLEDLNPIEVGEHNTSPNNFVRPKSFNGVIIHHIRSGWGDFTLGDDHYRVGPGQAFIILPGQEHRVHYTADRDDPWEYAWVSFTGKLAPHFSLLPPVFDVPKNTFAHTNNLANATDNIGYLLASDLFTLYARLVEPLLHVPDILPDIMEYFEQHYMQKLSVEEVAARFGSNRRELSRHFKARTGLSMRAYLTQVRMKQAQILLQKDYSTKEIAERCGFSSTSSFHKLFTTYHGITPVQWKQQNCT